MADPLPAERIAEIEARWDDPTPADIALAVADLRALLAEVKRLREGIEAQIACEETFVPGYELGRPARRGDGLPRLGGRAAPPAGGAMTPAQLAIARRLVAMPGWERAGMRILNADGVPGRISHVDEAGIWLEADGWWSSAAKAGPFTDLAPALPDLTDDANGGVLLGLVREAVGPTGPGLGMEWTSRVVLDWYTGDKYEYQRTAEGSTLAEAAALALLAVRGE